MGHELYEGGPFDEFFGYVVADTMEATADTYELFWSQRISHSKINLLLCLITRATSSPHAQHVEADARADASFRDLLREHGSLQGYFPDA